MAKSFLDRIGLKTAPYVIEFVGTFFLVLTVALNVTPDVVQRKPHPMGGFAIGCVLMVMIFLGGHISGGHYNPAVTLGVRLSMRHKITTLDTVLYIIIQLIAGFVAALVSYGLDFERTFAPAPASPSQSFKALCVEFLYTFALISVVLNVTTTKSQDGNSFFGLAIGFTVLAGAITVGDISGAAFNPSVATGPIIVKAMIGKATVQYLWIYWLGPFSASLAAAFVFRLTNPAEFKNNSVYTEIQ